MHKRIKPGQTVLIDSVGAVAFDMLAGQKPRKDKAGTILGRMVTLAGKLYNALVPFWVVHAAPIK